MNTPVTVQTALVTRAVDNQVQCQSISSRMPLCPGDIITIVAIALVVIIMIGCTAWSWQMFNRRGGAIMDEEQVVGDPHKPNPVSVENVVHGPNNPELVCSMSTIEVTPVESTEPDVFWSPQDQPPVLHYRLDPLPRTTVLEMTTMRRSRSAVRRFSWPAPATPSPRSSWAYSDTTLL